MFTELQNPQINFYCDVDGVLNIAKPNATHTQKIKRKLPSKLGFFLPKIKLRFRWDDDLLKSLSTAIKEKVNFIWLTTWNNDAVDQLEPITGLLSLEVMHYHLPFSDFRNQKTKYQLLRAHQALKPTPFIWVDDVATSQYSEEHWADHAHERLVIKPDSRFGITREHLESIEKFIIKHS